MKYFLTLCLMGMGLLFAQSDIQYDISFANRVHHEAEIEVSIPEIPAGPLQVRMSLSSPGRYAIHQFGKNVSNVRAFDQAGKPLDIERTTPEMWEVKRHSGFVKVTYTLFADLTDGTYSAIDEAHAHLNMPATFMWARGMEQRPILVTFHLPQGPDWKIATQLTPVRKPGTFAARDLQYFFDSPTELSNFALREWPVADKTGQTATFKLVVHHTGSDAVVDAFLVPVKQIVDEAIGVFGEMPPYENSAYTFLCDYLPGNEGDGMEHRNSTIITDLASPAGLEKDIIGTVSHEFFHSWNVERIRPLALEPFNFEQANMSGELWFAEGFTNYYGKLILARTGYYDLGTFAQKLNNSLNYVLNSPGANEASPVEMSKMAPFVDAATAVDPTAFYNTFTSYYPYGEITALALDLEIRSRFPGKSLDDYLQAVWRDFGKNEVPYTNLDLQATLAGVLNDKQFAEDFFNQYVFGHQRPDYTALLAQAGLQLQKASPGVASLGMESLTFKQDGLRISGGTLKGGALYQAGLEGGDLIQKINNKPVTSEKMLRKVLGAASPGDTWAVTFVREGKSHEASVVLGEKANLALIPFEALGKATTPEMIAFRKVWLGSKAQ